MSKYTRLNTPINVGACYPNGSSFTSWYRVLQINDEPGEVTLCRPSDGWTLTAHGAALYDTPQGQQLLWDYSTEGRFLPAHCESGSNGVLIAREAKGQSSVLIERGDTNRFS